MLKHATISRTNQAQQALRLQLHRERNQQIQQSTHTTDQSTAIEEQSNKLLSSSSSPPLILSGLATVDSIDFNNNMSLTTPLSSPQQITPTTLSSISPSPSLFSTPSKTMSSSTLHMSAFSSLTRSPSQHTTTVSNRSRMLCSSESMIKVFAQTLSQDVEYVTLHVNTQTKSNQVVRSLLKKFRLKHRDPNLYQLTLERWIRKDGLKHKSVMLLSDEASPLQLQQCCSNPPHNDIKFTLQMRTGTLVKIFCSDVAPDSRYKCLSLSDHTTVEETIELMLHCLNLINPSGTHRAPSCSTNNISHQLRSTDSPSSTGSSNSSNSSSSGIESDLTQREVGSVINHRANHGHLIDQNNHPTVIASPTAHRLDSESRTSSVTSISSNSNVSTVSTSITEQYCLVIECKNMNLLRMLDADEYLVDVYQSLLAEAKGPDTESPSVAKGNSSNDGPAKQQQPPEQWFFIKLKRRDHQNIINFANPRHNIPLPPIPLSMSQFVNADNLQNIMSTAQIEVNQRPNCSMAATSSAELSKPDQQPKPLPPPPPTIILLQPPIRPRRRNLSNASSTFGRPMVVNGNRRRYDPAQLAEDLSQLDVKDLDSSKSSITGTHLS